MFQKGAKKQVTVRNYKSCETCSFYDTDHSIDHLTSEEQIEFEKIDAESINSVKNQDLIRLQHLLQKIKRQTCIGGLTRPNETRNNCNYHKVLPSGYDRTQLISAFANMEVRLQSQKSRLTSAIFGSIAIAVSLWVAILTYQNIEYENQINDLNADIIELKDTISSLQEGPVVSNDSKKIKK